MRPRLLQTESLVEFFKCFVDEALNRQEQPALDLTRYYLVQLLASRSRSSQVGAGARLEDEPLALWLARALETGGSRQRVELRGLADHTLFVSGFFSDSLARSVVDVDYYASLGGYAYQQLSAQESDTFAPAYAELGSRFLAFADVLTEVSEQSGLTSDRDLLRLYDRWVKSGGRGTCQRLIRQGITPTLQARQAGTRSH